ncbi:hypothetical protein K438DRAFT_1973486 [Mycena galopus ATCC 62051]|nr:hypothetical protein K438DRAFT_1973486 [Mycena galopus ATCC 62051]
MLFQFQSGALLLNCDRIHVTQATSIIFVFVAGPSGPLVPSLITALTRRRTHKSSLAADVHPGACLTLLGDCTDAPSNQIAGPYPCGGLLASERLVTLLESRAEAEGDLPTANITRAELALGVLRNCAQLRNFRTDQGIVNGALM